jgi:pimeloyl-ACP methyl ester carboxylesterase
VTDPVPFDRFERALVDTGETTIAIRRGGDGPPVLLLHGFPETQLMWHRVAPALAGRFSVVCADLRGYGSSGTPPSAGDHAPYAKRAMAADMVRVMEHLGFARFSVVGHDRGGRVAYRLALDHDDRIERLALRPTRSSTPPSIPGARIPRASPATSAAPTSRRCATRPPPTPSARSTEPRRRSTSRPIVATLPTDTGSLPRRSCCGPRRALRAFLAGNDDV